MRAPQNKPPVRAALYLRLSRDDEGALESSSITNQRSLLTAYAKEHGFPIFYEYVDDGYSGTSFDRPGFQRMIRDIEAQKLNLVLVKDLSRLGRDYIQTGQYTEVYFPSKKVRCIAVNDGFDSESPYTDIVPFKHVVNEMYARDASKKIRSAFATKMKNGSYIGNFAPYGYQKDPNNKNRLLPDEGSAAVVQRLFEEAAKGVRPAALARELNRRGVLPPGLYRCSRHPQLDASACRRGQEWTPGGVSKLLRNVVYLGHTAQGKTTKVSFKSKLTLRNPQEDWVLVENTHTPLVSPKLFEAVRRRTKSRATEKTGQFHNLFSGLAHCADCGHGLSATASRKKGSPVNLLCGAYKLRGREACTNHFIAYAVLCQIILETVREELRLTEEAQSALRQALYARLEQEKSAPADGLKQLRAEEERLTRAIEQLYEDRMNARLEEPVFYRLLEKYTARQKALRERLDADGAPAPNPKEPEPPYALLSRTIEQGLAVPALTTGLLFALIDRIEVEQGRYEAAAGRRKKSQRVTVYFRFQTAPRTAEFQF